MDWRGPAKRCRILDRKAGVFRPSSIAVCVRTVRQARPCHARNRLDGVAKLLLARTGSLLRVLLLHDALAITRRPVGACSSEAPILPRPRILSNYEKIWNGRESG